MLYANVEVPLIIVNNALGYKIECHLMDFEYNYDMDYCTYFFSTKFLELIPNDEEEREKWDNNRRKAYLGSLKHFLISLIKNDFREKGFRIFQTDLNFGAEIKDANAILRQDPSRKNLYLMKFDNELVIRYSPGIWNSSQYSVLKILVDSVTLDEFGEPIEMLPFQRSRFWATRGVADLLPKNYSID